MNDSTSEVNTGQIAIWRNLLDAFGQLSSAWDAAADAQHGAAEGAQRGSGEGQSPSAVTLPDDLVEALTLAGARGSEALAGVAEVLAAQGGSEEIDAIAEAQRAASQRWESARADS